MAVGTLAELAIERTISAGLRSELETIKREVEGARVKQATLDARIAEAFAAGVHRGRAAWPLALLVGAAVGALGVCATLALASALVPW